MIGVSILGSPIAGLSCTAVVAFAFWILQARYGGDLGAADIEAVPGHRRTLDAMVAGNVRLAVVVGSVGGMVMLFAKRPDLGIAPASTVILAVTAAVILLSSLIDWYIILPRMSGLLGIRPCRDPEENFPRRPETWREVTRWWYIHRIVAAVVLRFGLSFAISLALARYIAVPHGAAIVAGALMGGFASYVAAAWDAFWQAGHLTLIVGRTVQRREVNRVPRKIVVFGWKLQLPFFTEGVAGQIQPREYVYDVALEGVQLSRVESREGAEVPRHDNGRILYERNPAKLPVKDINASRPKPAQPFIGCRGRCSGINWYCIENPRCFKNK
ncbi:MAG TPA: hypothetical protein VFJ64_04985 [Solirubrobacterales bacterium]|nr:hypothetical protein [Solirubrobacterales bacterium]